MNSKYQQGYRRMLVDMYRPDWAPFFRNMIPRRWPRCSSISPRRCSIASRLSSGFLFIDAINLDGSVNEDGYDRVGCVFAGTQQYEEYLGGDPIWDVAVHFPGHSQMDFAENGPVTNFIAE
jgi:hypothetical protein